MARTDADRFAAAAEAMVGAPFRLHGRDPENGLDCVGLVHASLGAIGREAIAPRGYQLRNLAIEDWLDHAERSGFNPIVSSTIGKVVRGDLLLVMPSPVQHHLMIAADPATVIHAHAGLHKVVCQPLADQGAVRAHWRLA
jgi:cell wall-associated NlpC family hydrolase